MLDLVREAPFGQLVRLITGNKVFKYPEEIDGFTCPNCYAGDGSANGATGDMEKPVTEVPENVQQSDESERPSISEFPKEGEDLEKAETVSSSHSNSTGILPTATLGLQRTQTLPWTADRFAIEQQMAVEKTRSTRIVAARTADNTVLVDWYTTDDTANPQNWSQRKKFFVALQINLYTFVVYAGSSIYVSAELQVMERFGVGEFKAAMGLALYVIGYGLGPLLFSPMSEIPLFGRNVPYIATFAIYVILAVPTALVDNLGGLLVLRFLQGFFGSPCLATGPATMADMYSLLYLPYSVAFWVSATFAAPALGPLISGFAVTAENWRWALWEILWMAGPIFILWFFFLPETSTSNILLRRAARLRKLTTNEKIRSQTEVDRKGITFGQIVTDAIVKPIEISIKDPAVMFVNVYTALIYGIYYSFFEVFALVYPPLYGFNIGETGLVFTCIVVGCLIAMVIYFSYLHFLLIPDILKNGLQVQEWRLRPALLACFGPTIGLFLFAWTANASIHWMAGVVGITIYAISCYIILQCIFVYVPMSYPQYAASLFAGNDFVRSLFAFGSVLFSRPMYIYLGIGKGVSLLGGLSVMGIFGMWGLYFYGAKLRARSKFAMN
ncbi:multidrug transporter [Aulographum hederae CBS 113979]|uniref:Multidrug transporter n=1 Tax=Aulographum hederae CBS 113979 TaxID=1176131 RepID=A0A6G1GPB2_9PEZI|nr:multidrug transporter [Aulographum hederae CBS 113979]